MANEIKGILFDKDGTLFDFHATWGAWTAGFIQDMAKGDSRVAVRVAEAMEYDLNAGAFLPGSIMVTNSMDGIMDAVLEALPDWTRPDLMAHVIETGSAAPQVPVVPLGPLMARFRAEGLKVGVVTNDNEEPAVAHLRSVNILESFDFVAGCDSGHGAKPEPGMLLAFCEVTGLDPASVVMVGDSTHDLHAGRAAGMVNIGVLTGPAITAELEPFADAVLNNIGEIPDWLAAFTLASR